MAIPIRKHPVYGRGTQTGGSHGWAGRVIKLLRHNHVHMRLLGRYFGDQCKEFFTTRRCRIVPTCMFSAAGPSSGKSVPCSADAGQGGSDALCRGLEQEVEDGRFDAFVLVEEVVGPEEDNVEDGSVNQGRESKYRRSANNSSPEGQCAAMIHHGMQCEKDYESGTDLV